MCRITSPSALICGVTSSAIPEKNGVNVTSRLVVAAVPVTVLLLHVGHEELVGAGLDHGLLIVQRRDARARQHARVALRLEQLDERVEVADVERERERGADRLARELESSGCRDRSSAGRRPAAARRRCCRPPDRLPPANVSPSACCCTAAQFTPAWKPSLSVTSMIFASSTTWRCAAPWMRSRYSPTGAQLVGHAAREHDARLRVHDDLAALGRCP